MTTRTMRKSPYRHKKRKSPYRHKVREHMRQRRPVRQYERGRGDKPKDIPGTRWRKVGKSGSSRYTVTVVYRIGEVEKISVNVDNYGQALDSGMEKRKKIEPPTMIIMKGGSM